MAWLNRLASGCGTSKAKGLGATYKEFALANSLNPDDSPLRDHRNELIHGISAPNQVLSALLLDAPTGQRPLAERLLLVVGAAMEIGTETQQILDDALSDLDLNALQADLPKDL